MSAQDVRRTVDGWRWLTEWLRVHAPTSYASLLPPAAADEIAEAQGRLGERCGFRFPPDLLALWAEAGGVRQLDLDELDEEGEVATGRFLPHGLLLTPAQSIRPRLVGFDPQGKDYWEGVEWVAPFGNYAEATDAGLYLSAAGLGEWTSYEGMYMNEPSYPTLAVYLETVRQTLTEGPAGRMGSQVPGIVHSCLIWQDPELPRLDETHADWQPLH